MSDTQEDVAQESTTFLMPNGDEVSNDPYFNAEKLLAAQQAVVAATPHTGTANPVGQGAASADKKQRKADKALREGSLVTNKKSDPDDDGDDDSTEGTQEPDDDYDTLTVPELQAEIRARNAANGTDIDEEGRKAHLIQRLRDDDNKE